GSDNYPPYNYEDANGKPKGIDVDLAKEAFRLASYKLPIKTKFVKKEEMGGEQA
ncbi:MAG: amino acid ABC transporter substrate-binding protein, partial [Ruminococcaceae bacterium]|nr:amino acid ABC transporter substrate-binding protein [Oscillospiraceae bacterium]